MKCSGQNLYFYLYNGKEKTDAKAVGRMRNRNTTLNSFFSKALIHLRFL